MRFVGLGLWTSCHPTWLPTRLWPPALGMGVVRTACTLIAARSAASLAVGLKQFELAGLADMVMSTGSIQQCSFARVSDSKLVPVSYLKEPAKILTPKARLPRLDALEDWPALDMASALRAAWAG